MRTLGINEEFVRQREIETKRIAARKPAGGDPSSGRPRGWDQPVTIRLAVAEDRFELEHLAERHDRRVPEGPSLIAALGARPVAALALTDGALLVDSDPGAAHLAALLRLRARQLSGRRHAVAKLIDLASRRTARPRS